MHISEVEKKGIIHFCETIPSRQKVLTTAERLRKRFGDCDQKIPVNESLNPIDTNEPT